MTNGVPEATHDQEEIDHQLGDSLDSLAPGISSQLAVKRMRAFAGMVALAHVIRRRKQCLHAEIGLLLTNLDLELARSTGYPLGEGVLIEAVVPGLAAASAGLSAGTLILRVDHAPAYSVEHYREAITHSRPRGRVVLLVRDQRGSRYVVMRLAAPGGPASVTPG